LSVLRNDYRVHREIKNNKEAKHINSSNQSLARTHIGLHGDLSSLIQFACIHSLSSHYTKNWIIWNDKRCNTHALWGFTFLCLSVRIYKVLFLMQRIKWDKSCKNFTKMLNYYCFLVNTHHKYKYKSITHNKNNTSHI
jgi:hypothetical protein